MDPTLPFTPLDHVIYDSLPYTEKSHPDYEAYAITLIDQEMQKSPANPGLNKGSAMSASPLFGSRGSCINKIEYLDLLQRGTSIRPIPIDFSKTHTAMEPTIQSPDSKEEDSQAVLSWQKSLNTAKIALEYQRIRLLHLELQAELESDLWKYHNSIIDVHHYQPVLKALENQRRVVDNINAKRKHQQESYMGPKLRVLETKWSELIGTNRQLVTAIKLLEDEVNSLRTELGDDGSFQEKEENAAFMDKEDDYYDD